MKKLIILFGLLFSSCQFIFTPNIYRDKFVVRAVATWGSKYRVELCSTNQNDRDLTLFYFHTDSLYSVGDTIRLK